MKQNILKIILALIALDKDLEESYETCSLTRHCNFIGEWLKITQSDCTNRRHFSPRRDFCFVLYIFFIIATYSSFHFLFLSKNSVIEENAVDDELSLKRKNVRERERYIACASHLRETCKWSLKESDISYYH